MICDRLERSHLYAHMDDRLAAGFVLLKRLLAEGSPEGRHGQDGGDVHAIVRSYVTGSPEGLMYEAHRRYTDIQCLAEGGETIYWAPAGQLTTATEYTEEEDVVLFAEADGSALRMMPGIFAVFFPSDAHKPDCQLDGPENVKKIVVKVRTPTGGAKR